MAVKKEIEPEEIEAERRLQDATVEISKLISEAGPEPRTINFPKPTDGRPWLIGKIVIQG